MSSLSPDSDPPDPCKTTLGLSTLRGSTQRLNCVQRNVTQCHDTFVTDFGTHVERECREDFVKTCHITFAAKAVNNTVRFELFRCQALRNIL